MAATPKKKVARKAKKQPRKRRVAKKNDLLVSVFTPTDNVKYLQECYASLCNQLYSNWEWILVPNGALDKPSRIPLKIRKDPRVKVSYFPLDTEEEVSIGSLKKYAVYLCNGQLYVELDHDDILTNDALFEIVKAYKKTGAGFIYSNFVSFREDGSSITYTEQSGWDSYPVTINEREYLASRAFDSTADAMHRLTTAPNHVRVWSKEAYNQTGGHDPAYSVCDDFDLMLRTYLAKVKFHHIDKCLYLYRQWNGSRSVAARNQEIQEIEGKLAHAHTHAVAREGSRRRGLSNIYVSTSLQDGSILYSDVEILEANSVGWLCARDILQFIPGSEVLSWLNIVWEKLAPGGWLSLAVPSTDGRAAFQVPTYKSFWNANSFMYLTNAVAARAIDDTKYNAHFHIARCWDAFPDDYHVRGNMLYANVDMIAIKDKRRIAGAQLIR